MSDKSKIEWTGATWNPVTGCSKVSSGCKNCYAERDWTRLSANPKTSYYGRKFTDVMVHPERLDQPLRWKKPRMIFVNSMSDLFHESVPDEFIDKVFAIMAACWVENKGHFFQILTKRPERMKAYFSDPNLENRLLVAGCECGHLFFDWLELYWPLKNVWLGVSIEDQKTADERIPILLETPAHIRWISAEPLLNAISLDCVPWPGSWRPSDDVIDSDGVHPLLNTRAKLDWVVVGGESGPNARPMHPEWIKSIRDQCANANVPFLFKQWGEWEIASHKNGHYDSNMITNKAYWVHPDGALTKPSHFRPGDVLNIKESESAYAMIKVGKKKAGRMLDGKLYDQYPTDKPKADPNETRI